MMAGNRDSDGDLAFDIAMSLRDAPLKSARGVDDLRLIAARVVEQLRLCRWRFERSPPETLHGPIFNTGHQRTMIEGDTREWLARAEKDFRRSVDAAILIGREAAGHFVEARLGISTWLFTRVVAISVSIEKLLTPSRHDNSEISSLDFGSVGSLARDLVENILMFLYISENTPKDEWLMRKHLFDLHDCVSREQLFRIMNNGEEAAKFAEMIPTLQNRLEKDAAFKALSKEFRNKLIKGERARVSSNEQLLAAAGFDMGSYRTMVKLWSANMHATPLAWHRMDEHDGGRNVHSERDAAYTAITLEYSTKLLDYATNRKNELNKEIVQCTAPTISAD